MNNTETRLELYDGSQWYNIPMAQDIPISINLSIADVREPDKVKASGSKTVTIPFSKEANKFFEFIFQTNIDLQTFDPNLKTPAKYYIGERVVFEGDLQIIKIVKKDHGTVTEGQYECNIVGKEGGIFIDMGDTLLEDLDYSDLDHSFTYTADKFAPSVVGTGYAYGFIDYGFGDVTNQVWAWENLKVGIFEREYLDRIFTYFGYTWQSNFLDSAFYKRLWIPCVDEGKMRQSQTEIDNAQFYAGQTVYQTGWGIMPGIYLPSPTFPAYVPGQNATVGPGWLYGTNPGVGIGGVDELDKGYYNDDTTTPFFDTGNVYSTATQHFTCNLSSIYQVAAYTKLRFYFDNSLLGTPPVYYSGSIQVTVYYNIEYLSGGLWYIQAQTSRTFTITDGGNYDVEAFLSTPDIQINSGTQYRVFVKAHAIGVMNYLDGGLNTITTGASTLVVDFYDDNYFYAKITNPAIQYGQNLDVGLTVPKDVKCKDFFKWIIQRFNLRVEPLEDNPKTLVIEPYADFYTTSAGLDWTDKVDVNSPIEVKPMGELEGRTYRFTYKEDRDVYNEDYQGKYKEAYGTERIDVNNDFVRGEKKNELGFSNTPIVGNIYNTMAVPYLFKVDNSGTRKALKCNIRSMYWGGLLATTPYTFTYNGTTETRTTYPYVGFVNNPANPTIDLSFDNPYKLYWSLPAQTFTNNNLYNLYWKQFIDEITNKNSKIITYKARLNPQDIKGFSFRNVIFIIDAYYIVNKIMNYNPLDVTTCTVELLKLQNVELFTPDNLLPVGPGGGGGAVEIGAGLGGGYLGGGLGTGGGVGGGFTGGGAISYGTGNIILGEGNVVG